MPSDTTTTILECLLDDIADKEPFISIGESSCAKAILYAWNRECLEPGESEFRALRYWWYQVRKREDYDDFIGCYDLEYELTPRGLKLRKQALECGGHQG